MRAARVEQPKFTQFARPGSLLPGRPRNAGLPRRHGGEALVEEPLQPPPLIGLDGVEVAFRIGREVVQRIPLARIMPALSKRRQLGQARAIEDPDLLIAAVRDIEKPLLRIAGEVDVPRRTVAAR